MRHLRGKALIWILGLTLCVLLPTASLAQQEVEFSGHSWILQGDMKLAEHLGRPALLARTGRAVLQGTSFRDGIIEFDMAVTGHRSFAGVSFRADNDSGTFEDFYLRPHNSDRFDAMQYTPVFHQRSAWQLYPEYNASTSIPQDRWIHVRLVIAGSDLQAYIDGQESPALHVSHLRGSPQSGAIALKSFFPAAGTTDIYPNAFSALTVQPATESAPSLSDTLPEPDSGIIARWQISPSMAAPEETPHQLPAISPVDEDWDEALTDETGRLNISRQRAFPAGAARGAVLARVVIHSDRQQSRRLSFGFSDQVSIFLNGRPVYSGDNTYRTRSPKFLGVMTQEHQMLYLDLSKGSNELTFMVSESFGGWGLTARLDSLEGLRLTP